MVPVAVIELDEPHAALGQPPREQAVGGERAVGRLARRTARARAAARRRCPSAPARSSACGRPARTARCACRSPGLRSVSLRSRFELVDRVDRRRRCRCVRRRPADCRGSAPRSPCEWNCDALEPAGQEAAVPLPRGDRLRIAAALAMLVSTTKPGRFVGFAAQAVRDPRAHARPAGDRRAGVHHRVGRIVIDLVGVHRADDADVVGDAADVRQAVR